MLNTEKNIAEQFNDNVEELIKKLSGKGLESGVKLIDNVISFVGMAGGCGTSFLVSNLAHIIANKYNLQILVIDMNILYPIQYTYFKGKIAREKPDLVSFLLGRNEIGRSIDTKKNTSILYASDRHLMDAINCDGEKASSAFSGLIDNIKYLFDVILIDCPSKLEHDVVNTALFKSDSIYTVWSESLSCIANADRFLSNLAVTGIDNTKVRAIMNKRTNVQYSSSTFKDLGYDLVAVLPFDLAVIESDLQGQIFSAHGDSMSKTAKILAERLDDLTFDVLANGGYKPKQKSNNKKIKIDNKLNKMNLNKGDDLTDGEEES
jgi:cellulose biosynthesis protein BcsQ